jgi:acetyl esterase/lipase
LASLWFLVGGLVLQTELLSVEDILKLPSPVADHRIAYGDDPLQFGDLRLPDAKGPHPVAVVVHGGCWRSRYTLHHIGSFSDALTREGVATWTVEYRRVGDAGGGWPGTFRDVAAAVDHLREIAPHYALDLERVIAVGHSAGGQLVLWLGARGKLPATSPISTKRRVPLAGVVSLAGVDDLRRALTEGVCDDMAARLVGGAPGDVPERYRESSPIELLPLGLPLRLVNGARDPIVPVDFGRAFESRSRAAGDDVKLTTVEGAGHFELIAPSSSAWPEVLGVIRELLSR